MYLGNIFQIPSVPATRRRTSDASTRMPPGVPEIVILLPMAGFKRNETAPLQMESHEPPRLQQPLRHFRGRDANKSGGHDRSEPNRLQKSIVQKSFIADNPINFLPCKARRLRGGMHQISRLDSMQWRPKLAGIKKSGDLLAGISTTIGAELRVRKANRVRLGFLFTGCVAGGVTFKHTSMNKTTTSCYSRTGVM